MDPPVASPKDSESKHVDTPVLVTAPATAVPGELESSKAVVEDLADRIPSTFTGFLWEVLMGSDAEACRPTDESPIKSGVDVDDINPNSTNFELNHSNKEELVEANLSLQEPAAANRATGNSLLATVWGLVPPALTGVAASSIDAIPSVAEESAVVVLPPASTDSRQEQEALAAPLLKGDEAYESIVRNNSFYQEICGNLPRRFQHSASWSLIFALEKHGVSLRTFYDNCQSYCEDFYDGNASNCPSLLIIKDNQGSVFGGFVTEMWRSNSGSGAVRESAVSPLSAAASNRTMLRGASTRSYYGTGECVLASGKVEIYPWTGANDYFILSEVDFIALGGGDGKFSLFLDGDLYKGHSESAPTFSNKQSLCSGEREDFICVSLELWGIDP